jgi:uncharacterized membrane protein YjjB (DUF3815 family)
MTALPTWPVAALGLTVGFAVAVVTDVRWLGGIVLLAAATWCGRIWLRDHGPRVTAALVGVFLAAFVLSHLLGHLIGAWPSVATVSAITGLVTWAVADRRPPGPPRAARADAI